MGALSARRAEGGGGTFGSAGSTGWTMPSLPDCLPFAVFGAEQRAAGGCATGATGGRGEDDGRPEGEEQEPDAEGEPDADGGEGPPVLRPGEELRFVPDGLPLGGPRGGRLCGPAPRPRQPPAAAGDLVEA
jgi:hypothetical protein